MIDKTVLELVDRLVATANRATKAEAKIDDITAKLVAARDELDNARTQIADLNVQIKNLKEEVESKQESARFWCNEARKAEAELKKGKHEEATDDKT